MLMRENDPEPEKRCCVDATCPEASSSLWTCSNQYEDAVLARSVCPFRSQYCGKRQILLNQTGDNLSLNLTLPPGLVCFFQVRALCGLPAFGPDKTDHIDITFFEFNDEDADNSAVSNSSGFVFPKPPKRKNTKSPKKN